MEESKVLEELNIKPGDRVERKGSSGPRGTVQKVRVETIRTSLRQDGGEPPGVSIQVIWDNGTLSHFVPDGLKVIKSG